MLTCCSCPRNRFAEDEIAFFISCKILDFSFDRVLLQFARMRRARALENIFMKKLQTEEK
jgi:hypothetical protein